MLQRRIFFLPCLEIDRLAWMYASRKYIDVSCQATGDASCHAAALAEYIMARSNTMWHVLAMSVRSESPLLRAIGTTAPSSSRTSGRPNNRLVAAAYIEHGEGGRWSGPGGGGRRQRAPSRTRRGRQGCLVARHHGLVAQDGGPTTVAPLRGELVLGARSRRLGRGGLVMA